jgi:uncharacterized protein (TIGR02145 family)
MKKYISTFKYIALVAIFSLAIISCKKDEPLPVEGSLATDTGSVTDLEGNVYKTVKIGNQTWMAENLRSTVFDRVTQMVLEYDTVGVVYDTLIVYDTISSQPLVIDTIYTTDSSFVITTDTSYVEVDITVNLAAGGNLWNAAAAPYYVPYLNISDNAENLGYLYNGLVVLSNRNICPNGWKIPNEDDWQELSLFLDSDRSYDGTNSAGGKLKSLDVSTWEQPNVGATNESGFNALPSGARFTNVDVPTNAFSQYQGLGRIAAFWIKSPVSPQQPLLKKAVLTTGSASLSISNENRTSGLAIRCIKE